MEAVEIEVDDEDARLRGGACCLPSLIVGTTERGGGINVHGVDSWAEIIVTCKGVAEPCVFIASDK